MLISTESHIGPDVVLSCKTTSKKKCDSMWDRPTPNICWVPPSHTKG